jgi:hypothetical protein
LVIRKNPHWTSNRISEELAKHFDNDPVRFFKQIIMPLLPTEVKMKLGADEEGGLPAVACLSFHSTPNPR